ncbi:MAG: hypothetical protein K2J78_06505 [Muribaculaceae bacterium]|nr:hypothetical protein [Muribaculaceae bacterium]MDE6769357.1 hypothetical protein [Muribaculaceae bacterium]
MEKITLTESKNNAIPQNKRTNKVNFTFFNSNLTFAAIHRRVPGDTLPDSGANFSAKLGKNGKIKKKRGKIMGFWHANFYLKPSKVC